MSNQSGTGNSFNNNFNTGNNQFQTQNSNSFSNNNSMYTMNSMNGYNPTEQQGYGFIPNTGGDMNYPKLDNSNSGNNHGNNFNNKNTYINPNSNNSQLRSTNQNKDPLADLFG